MTVKTWKEGESGEPKFSENFDILKKVVLQVTDIVTNRNKYYGIELHSYKNKFRIYTHYGRTDDLDSNPNAGIRESRYCNSLSEAESVYNKILSEKTSPRKGYKEINLASSKIGSKKSSGQSSGIIDSKTLEKIALSSNDKLIQVNIDKPIQDLISLLYSEATNALVNTVNASITANGIETPLGVLTIGQIDKGQEVLDELVKIFQNKKSSYDELTKLSGDFYTLVPHKFGRSKSAAENAIIDSGDKILEKQETLQLMRDMLNVNGKSNVLINPDIENKYKALCCKITSLNKNSVEFKKVIDYLGISSSKIKNAFSISREIEEKDFTQNINNQKLLLHGSSAKNWIGILSRGILLPKTVVTLGIKRTDAGWLGSGIYFGDVMKTSYYYAGPSKTNTRFIAIVNVALGNVKKYTKITYGLKEPPIGYDSCHGVKGTEFSDDEFVIYKQNQQKLQYLLECF